MVNAKDKDILSLVDGNGEYKYSYACFLKKDDEFFVVSFTQDQSKVMWEEKENLLVDSFEMFQYAKFKNGVSDDYQLLNLTWRKRRGALNEAAMGEATDVHKSEKPARALIDESEIGLTYSFKNVSGVDTDVNIQIRRSTLKYVMTFSVEKDHAQFSELGSCVKLASPKT